MKRSWMRRSSKPMKRAGFSRPPGLTRRGPVVRKQNGSRVMPDGRIVLGSKDYAALRVAVYMRDQGICAICRRYVEWCEYELDHYKGLDGEPLLSRGMGGSKRHDSMESCRTTHEFCNRDRVRKERPVDAGSSRS